MYLKLLTEQNVKEYAFVLPDALVNRPEFLGVVCLEEDGEALGTAVVLPRDEEEILEIQWLYVLPEHRRTGAGSLMLEGIRDMAKKASLSLIEVYSWETDISGEEPDEEELTGDRIIKRFLLENEFVTMREYPIYSFLVSDLEAADLIKTHAAANRKAEGGYDCVPFTLLSAEDVREFGSLILENGFTDYTGICTENISFACFREDQPAGCLLATDDPDEQQITVMLVMNFTSDPLCTMELAAAAGKLALAEYPREYRIAFVAVREDIVMLLESRMNMKDRVKRIGHTVRGVSGV